MQDNFAVISLAPNLEFFVKGFEKNGRKELVRGAVAEAFGAGVGIRFHVESPPVVAAEAPAPVAPVRRSVPPAAPIAAPVSSTVRITPELLASLRDDPLICAVIDQLGATVVKVSEE